MSSCQSYFISLLFPFFLPPFPLLSSFLALSLCLNYSQSWKICNHFTPNANIQNSVNWQGRKTRHSLGHLAWGLWELSGSSQTAEPWAVGKPGQQTPTWAKLPICHLKMLPGQCSSHRFLLGQCSSHRFPPRQRFPPGQCSSTQISFTSYKTPLSTSFLKALSESKLHFSNGI